MRSIRTRLGLKQVVAALVAATVLVTGGVVLAQSGDPEEAAKQSDGAGPAAIVSQRPEARFVPVTPCRLVDTRETSKMAAGQLRAFAMTGNDLSGQGGSDTGCAIPARASAVSVNVTAVSPAGKGYLRAGAACSYVIIAPTCAQSVPDATALNYSTGLSLSNGIDIPVCSQWTVDVNFVACNGGAFVVKAFTAATHVVVDVTGYYARPVFAIVDGDDNNGADPYPYPATVVRSSGIGNIQHINVGQYALTSVDDLRGCAFTATSGASDDQQAPRHDAMVSVEHDTATEFRVIVTDDTGALANSEFTLVVAC